MPANDGRSVLLSVCHYLTNVAGAPIVGLFCIGRPVLLSKDIKVFAGVAFGGGSAMVPASVQLPPKSVGAHKA